MKILVGTLLAVVVALGITGWRLQVAWEDLAVSRTQTQAVRAELERQVQAGELLAGRVDALNDSMTRLHKTTETHTRQLGLTLAGIDRIEKTEGDDDGALECLDLRVPGELDSWLR